MKGKTWNSPEIRLMHFAISSDDRWPQTEHTKESEGRAPTSGITQPSPDRLWPTRALLISSKMVPQTDSIMIEPVLTPYRPHTDGRANTQTGLSLRSASRCPPQENIQKKME